MNDYTKYSLPIKIEREYQLTSLLSLHENAIVLSVEKKKTALKKIHTIGQDISFEILKIIPKTYFDSHLFDALQNLHHPLLLLPIVLFSEADFIYAGYPKLKTLLDILCQEKLSFSILLRWIKDMDEIVSSLHKNNIIHGDIAPGNIYLSREGNFLLGDFSSSRLISPQRKKRIVHPNKKRTGSTFPCPCPATDFLQDTFSFLTILLQLLKGFTALEENTNILMPLQNNIENLLSEIETKKKPPLSFHHVCKKILLEIEQEELENMLPHRECFFSPEDLDKLDGTTTKTDKLGFPFISLPDIKSSAALWGLAICSFLFVLSLVFYLFTGQRYNSTTLSSGHKQKSDTLLSKHNEASTMDIFKTKPPQKTLPPTKKEITAVTDTPPPSALLPAAPTANSKEKTILDIAENNYQKIPENISKAPSVKIIFANKNLFQSISSFSQYTSLEELYLDNNSIKNIGDTANFAKLSVLGLSNNDITDVSALSRLTSLTILDLSCQKHLSGLPSLAKLKKLKYLILTETNAAKKDIKYLQQNLPECTILD